MEACGNNSSNAASNKKVTERRYIRAPSSSDIVTGRTRASISMGKVNSRNSPFTIAPIMGESILSGRSLINSIKEAPRAPVKTRPSGRTISTVLRDEIIFGLFPSTPIFIIIIPLGQ